MSISYAVFPGFKPGTVWTPPGVPVRSPMWSFHESDQFMNDVQRSVSGKATVTKYWSNPLRMFEWKYGYIKDNPADVGAFYTQTSGVTIPHSDFKMLRGFYRAMQGSGTQFALQPPDNYMGGTWSIGSGTFTATTVTFTSMATGAAAALSGLVGRPLLVLNSAASSLNGQYLTIFSVNSGLNQVTCLFNGGSGSFSGTLGSNGCVTLGAIQGTADSNDNIELVHTPGSYPAISTSGTYGGSVTLVPESVQLIDTSTLVVYDGNGNNITSHQTLATPNSITPPLSYQPYVGYVMQFGSYSIPSTPVTASYSLYYICRFSEDTQDYENFMTMLWLANSVKFQQDRI